MNHRICIYLLLMPVMLLALACKQQTDDNNLYGKSAKLTAVTTLFPLYDFTRSIGGDKVETMLLLPPGVEPHGFEPRPEDAVTTARADLFVYTNPQMEPWAEKFARGVASKGLLVVDASAGIQLMPAGADHDEHDGDADHGDGHKHKHQHQHNLDPHIWLDPVNARQMARNIADALIAKDPDNTGYYQQNFQQLSEQLLKLDNDYRSGLSKCNSRVLLHGGHYAFGYLARRYNLDYQAAMSVSADAEPTPTRMMELVKQIRASGVSHIFSEEQISSRLTDSLAREAGVQVLRLHNLHNISRLEQQTATDYITLMEQNLKQLQAGLGCN